MCVDRLTNALYVTSMISLRRQSCFIDRITNGFLFSWCHCWFFKTLFKRDTFCSLREGYSKFDFDHHFAFVPSSWKERTFLLNGILFGSSRGSFSKRKLYKTDLQFRSDFVKLGSEIIYLFLAEKTVDYCFVCCNTLPEFGLSFFKLKFSSSWETCF